MQINQDLKRIPVEGLGPKNTPLELPITVFAGRQNEHVSEPQAQAWSHETQGDARVHWYDGNHFFIGAQRERIIESGGDAMRAETFA